MSALDRRPLLHGLTLLPSGLACASETGTSADATAVTPDAAANTDASDNVLRQSPNDDGLMSTERQADGAMLAEKAFAIAF